MPTEIIGKLQVRTQRKKRADGSIKEDVKLFVYIPTRLWRDSQFPFNIETQDVHIRVGKDGNTGAGILVVGKASNKP